MAAHGPDVLIVGAGPAGVVAALLLGDLGVSTLVIDKRTEVSTLPRARGIHARATEILRQLRIETDMVSAALPVDPRMEVRATLGAEPVAVVSTGGPSWTEVSPCDGIAIAQDVFETVLRAHLVRRPSVQLQLGVRLTGLDVDNRGVSATLTDLASGRVTTSSPAFVIGADGWRSDTRRLVGIDMLGDDDLGTSRSVRFRADLSPWLGSPPPAFVRLLSCNGVLLPTHPDDRWVAIRTGADPGVPPPADFVRHCLGVEVPVEVLGDDTWTAAVQQAQQFSSGPVFLVGDAAHRVTPAGATGISSAMADAHNLTWKIGAVLAGWGGPGLLDTYAVERREVARVLCAVNQEIWGDVLADRMTDVDLRLLDMGYVYASDVIQEAPSVEAETPWWEHKVDGTQSAYVPTARQGARAPHAWLHPNGRRISTIDLFGRGFVLLTDDLGAHWADAVRLGVASGRPPVSAVSLSEPSAALPYALAPGEAVLVRPDGHVAWRSGPGTHLTQEDAVNRLEHALDMATGARPQTNGR